MYCVKCGAQLEENRSFCPSCGAKAEEPSVPVVNEEVLADRVSPEAPAQTGAPNQAAAPVTPVMSAPPAAPVPPAEAKKPAGAADIVEKAKANPLYVALTGCGVMLISLFMPFVTMTFFVKISLSYISGDGKIALVLIAATAALMWKEQHKIAIGTLAVAVLMALYSAVNVMGESGGGVIVSLGLGFYLYILGAAAVGEGLYLAMKKKA